MVISRWRALVIYLYRGDISFRPLKSDRRPLILSAKTRMDNSVDKSGGATLPCSPKSMYRLADRFGLQELKILSFKAIISGLTEGNIAHELFSKFTSKYSEIQEDEIIFACDHYNSSNVAATLQRKVQELVDGEHQHAKFVFKALFEKLEPRRRAAPPPFSSRSGLPHARPRATPSLSAEGGE
jgi:hypothetical protein